MSLAFIVAVVLAASCFVWVWLGAVVLAFLDSNDLKILKWANERGAVWVLVAWPYYVARIKKVREAAGIP